MSNKQLRKNPQLRKVLSELKRNMQSYSRKHGTDQQWEEVKTRTLQKLRVIDKLNKVNKIKDRSRRVKIGSRILESRNS